MQSDNLISLKDDMIAFIAGHGMRRLNGYVAEEVPTVLFEEDNPDGWKDFILMGVLQSEYLSQPKTVRAAESGAARSPQ